MNGNSAPRGGSGLIETDWQPDVALGVTIVHAVSDAIDVPVERVNFELNDYVDPDALDALFADRADGTPRKGGRLTLRIEDCDVTVGSDRRVTVRPET